MSKMSNLHAILTERGELPECPDDSDYDAPDNTCPTCGGSGGGPEVYRCRSCGGSGVRKVKREDPNADDNRPLFACPDFRMHRE